MSGSTTTSVAVPSMVGAGRFAALYFTWLLAGSFAILLLQETSYLTVGAPAAAFGVAGAALVLRHRRMRTPETALMVFLMGFSLVYTASRDLDVAWQIGGAC